MENASAQVTIWMIFCLYIIHLVPSFGLLCQSRGEHKWIVNAVRRRVSLLAVFDREKAHDLTFITDVARNILESVTNLLGINSKKSNKKQ